MPFIATLTDTSSPGMITTFDRSLASAIASALPQIRSDRPASSVARSGQWPRDPNNPVSAAIGEGRHIIHGQRDRIQTRRGSYPGRSSATSLRSWSVSHLPEIRRSGGQDCERRRADGRHSQCSRCSISLACDRAR
jgi:hypothetical protein